jgi:Ca2+-binding EF-hand superfamily protein
MMMESLAGGHVPPEEMMADDEFAWVVDALCVKWLMCLFVNFIPVPLLLILWDHLLLPSPFGRQVPICGFVLAALSLGEKMLLDPLAPDTAADILMSILTRTESLQEPADQEAFIQDFGFFCEKIEPSWLASKLAVLKQQLAYADLRLSRLGSITKFTESELQRLQEEFSSFENGVPLDVFKSFVQHVSPEFPSDYCHVLFERLDTFGRGSLHFHELMVGLSALSFGTVEEKLRICFDLFDSQRIGYLTRADMFHLSDVLYKLAGVRRVKTQDESALDRTPKKRTGDAYWFDCSPDILQSTVPIRRTESPQEDLPEAARTLVLKLLLYTHDGRTTFQMFREAALTDVRLLRIFRWCLPTPPVDVLPSLHIIMNQPDVRHHMLHMSRTGVACGRVRQCFRHAREAVCVIA